VWREEGNSIPFGRIDFYISTDTELRNGFQFRGTATFPGFTSGETRDPQYQSINLFWPAITQSADALRLFLIGTENTSASAPIGKGNNVADLFELVIPKATLDDGNAAPSLFAVGFTDSILRPARILQLRLCRWCLPQQRTG
jgi:hypothetical protein